MIKMNHFFLLSFTVIYFGCATESKFSEDPLAKSSTRSLASNSESCLQDICIDDSVIDLHNYEGKVVGVDQNTETIKYSSNGYTRSAPPNQLSKEVNSPIFTANKVVIDQHNYVGTVSKVFKDGRIVYLREGYSSTSVSTSLSPEVKSYKHLVKDALVIDGNNFTGKVKRIFADGRTFYLKDGYSNPSLASNPDELILEVAQYKNLKVDTVIIDSDNYIGKAKRFFADGRILYLKDGYSNQSITRKPEELVVEVYEFGRLKIDTVVVDPNNYIGKAKRFFEDGRIFYLKDGYSNLSLTKKPDELVPEVLNFEKLGKEASVIDQDNYPGKVKRLFADGRIFYLKDGYSNLSNTFAKNLHLEVRSIGEYVVGTMIVDQNNYTGLIKRLFENKIAFYLKNGYSNYSTAEIKTLSPEVDTHPKYTKGTLYADEAHSVGTALRFFQNGKILLDNGRVATDLYSRVDTLGDISEGAIVKTVLGVEGVITSLFENKTAQYEVKKEKGTKSISGQILISKKDQDEMAQRWLESVFEFIYRADQQGAEALKKTFGTDLVVKNDDFLTYNQAVSKAFNDGKIRSTWITDKKIIQQVKKYFLALEGKTQDDTPSTSDLPKMAFVVYLDEGKYESAVTDYFSKKNIEFSYVGKKEIAKANITLKIKKGIFKKHCQVDAEYVKDKKSIVVVRDLPYGCEDVIDAALDGLFEMVKF